MALLTEIDVAEHIGVSLQTVRRWRRERLGPPYVKIEASVRYRQEDLDAFVERSVIETNTKPFSSSDVVSTWTEGLVDD